MADREKMKELKRELLSEVDALMDRLIAERMGIPMEGEEGMEMGMEEDMMPEEPGIEESPMPMEEMDMPEEPGMEGDMEMGEEESDLSPGFMDMLKNRKKEDEE